MSTTNLHDKITQRIRVKREELKKIQRRIDELEHLGQTVGLTSGTDYELQDQHRRLAAVQSVISELEMLIR